jgi:cysteine-rich repeat protein
MYSKLDVLCGGSACVCYEGFRQEVGCPEICGDGRLYVLDCDDGNTQEGDGCNNQCEVEQDWKCFKTGGWSTSGCTYVGYFTMGFVTADKNVGNDTANITLTVSPWFADMHSLNWLNILTTNSTSYTPIAI